MLVIFFIGVQSLIELKIVRIKIDQSCLHRLLLSDRTILQGWSHQQENTLTLLVFGLNVEGLSRSNHTDKRGQLESSQQAKAHTEKYPAFLLQ